MEVVVAIISSAVTEAGRSLCGSFPSIKNFIRFQSNLTTLEKDMKSLVDLKRKVIEDVDSSDAQMMQWLREVEQIMLIVNSFQASMTASNQKLCGSFFNCIERYRLCTETARMPKEVERLLKAGDIVAKMGAPNYFTKAVEHIPGPSIVNQTTASTNLAKVMDLLNNNDVLRIGIWGMGGVGKTTLAKNLNNMFKGSSSTQQFGIVIWATVSKKLDLKKVQIQIAERLNLKTSMAESVERLAIRLHQRLQEENFLLILDDVWETIDLDCLGVPQPQPDDHTGSKIILTSRSLEVCREMMTDAEVKVDVLDDVESWQLFTKNVGKVATSEHIEPIAKAVARECSGLPLAIITVGTAMRGKTMIELWKDALNELRRSVPNIQGIENKVYKPLKLSYDSLQGNNIKPCFLYCCLYPEDFSIDVSELVNCWLGEGLIDEQRNYENSYNRGVALIENLKDSCMLEHGTREGTVKMHDVVRDVGIWISHSLKDGCKSLVRSGFGLTQISEAQMSESLKRISFVNNKLTKLPKCGICCPKTSSLLLQGNLPLERIPDEFLQAFQSIRVLNLSGTRIQLLPQSILELGELRVLLLRNCICLEELPQLGMLSKLQVLDCCDTRIRELPNGMENLSNLRQLYLSRTYNLRTIQEGVINRLSGLEVLDMSLSAYIWAVEQQEGKANATFGELLCLERLLVLSIRLEGIPSHGGHTWIGRLRKFQFILGPYPTTFWQTELYGKRVTLSGLDSLGGMTGLLLTNATSLVLDCCEVLNEMLTLGIENAGCFAGLKSLTIANSEFRGVSRDYVSKLDLLPNLEELHVLNVKQLESVSQLIRLLGLNLSRIRILEVTMCPELRFLISCGNPYLSMEMLEVIKVSFCNGLCELFQHSPGETEDPVLSLVPSLRTIQVTNCNALRQFPLRDLNPNTIQEISGDELWWSKLEDGSDENTKVRLQHCFKPVKANIQPQSYRILSSRFG